MTTRRNWTRNRVAMRMGLVLSVGAALLLGGCKKPPPEPPPPPPPPPPIVVPEPLDVASLLQSMDVDARVEFAEVAAPVDRGLAEAAIGLADAFARGDDEALRALLDKGDQRILEQLLASEHWWEETEKIEAVRVAYISAALQEGPEESQIGIALQDPSGSYLLMWDARKVFDEWVFSAGFPVDGVRPRASEWDGAIESSFIGGVMAYGGLDVEPAILELLRKAMADPSSLSMEQLLSLKAYFESLAEDEEDFAELIRIVDEEIAKRGERDTGDGGASGGGGGGGSSPGRDRDPPSGPGPGGPG